MAADDLAGGETNLTTELGGITPNPSTGSGSAKVRFSLAEPQSARMVLLDAAGRELRVVADGTFEAGHHAYALPTAQLRPGFYSLRLTTGAQQFVRKWLVQP